MKLKLRKRVILKTDKCEKSEKSVLPIFQLEPAVIQFVPDKTRGLGFSDFPKNFRGYMGGIIASSNPMIQPPRLRRR